MSPRTGQNNAVINTTPVGATGREPVASPCHQLDSAACFNTARNNAAYDNGACNNEACNNEACNNEASNNEASNNEASNNEASNNEASNNEASNNEASHDERRDTVQRPADHRSRALSSFQPGDGEVGGSTAWCRRNGRSPW
jgi:hypothetical protein